MAAKKPGKAELLAAFFDDGSYSALFADGPVSAAYGCANGQSTYVVFQNGQPIGVDDIEKTIRVLAMAAETGAPVVTFYDSTGACLENGLALLNANSRLTAADCPHFRRCTAGGGRDWHLCGFRFGAGSCRRPLHHERGGRALPERAVQQ